MSASRRCPRSGISMPTKQSGGSWSKSPPIARYARTTWNGRFLACCSFQMRAKSFANLQRRPNEGCSRTMASRTRVLRSCGVRSRPLRCRSRRRAAESIRRGDVRRRRAAPNGRTRTTKLSRQSFRRCDTPACRSVRSQCACSASRSNGRAHAPRPSRPERASRRSSFGTSRSASRRPWAVR